MWSWIKELFTKEDYIEWTAFTDHLDEMELAEFHERVKSENKNNIEI